mmetsp:Transcript_29722/g.79861  ORF Transcript_29722/g.79861 Transcript_29722/m.79861 type:complete len:124 (+) Transcript_29722:33-404(+)
MSPTLHALARMPDEILTKCFEDLEAPDLGHMACVSRAFRDRVGSPSVWKQLCKDDHDYGFLPREMSRAVIVRQHIRDSKAKREGASHQGRQVPKSAKKQRTWEDDWSLPICDWLDENRTLRVC